MRVSAMIRINAAMHADGRLIDRITDFGRKVEAWGFPASGSATRWAAAGRRSIRCRC